MRWLTLLVAAIAASCGPDTPDPPPPVDVCLATNTPSAVSLEIEVDQAPVDGILAVTASCTASRVVRNDAITRINLAACEGSTTSATVAIGSVPALRLDINEGERLTLTYERTRPDLERHRFVLRRADASVVAAIHTGSAIEQDDFYAPLAFRDLDTECPPVPQMCFSAVKRIVEIRTPSKTIQAPTRHAIDDGGVHVRVEQADQLADQVGCSLPGAWYDFLVAVDRPGI